METQRARQDPWCLRTSKWGITHAEESGGPDDLWITTLGKRVGSSPRKGGTAMTPGEGQCVAVRFPTDPVVNTLATARALCWDPME